MKNEKYKPYPANPRYSISNYGNVIDTDTGCKVDKHFTPTNKQYCKMVQPDDTIHTVYMVFALALTFKGARPSVNHHATLINPRGGYTADNVCWESEQEKNRKKIKKNQINRVLDVMTIDQLSYVYSMIEGLTSDASEPEPEIEYAPVPELPADTLAAICGDTPKPQMSIAELLEAMKKSKENR